MKFVISSSSLLSLLSSAGKVVSSKNTLPILDYFLLSVKGNDLTVTASDLETTMVATTAVDRVEQEGSVAAPVKLMLDSLKEFSEQPLTIETVESGENVTINVVWRSGQLSIPGTLAVGFPLPPALTDDSVKLNMNVDMLLTGINKTIFATADTDLHPVMSGVFVNIESEGITFVATDAHKLVRYTCQQESQNPSSFILPKKPANLLRTLLLKEDDEVSVAFDKKNVCFTLKNSTLICRLIEGVYPNYNAVIPPANPNRVIVDRVELMNAIKRVSVCSSQATNLIKFNIMHDSINLTAEDREYAYKADENVSCSYEGTDIVIGFKSTFLVDILSNIETPSVAVELADSSRPGVFKPIYDDQPRSATLMLLMPMITN